MTKHVGKPLCTSDAAEDGSFFTASAIPEVWHVLSCSSLGVHSTFRRSLPRKLKEIAPGPCGMGCEINNAAVSFEKVLHGDLPSGYGACGGWRKIRLMADLMGKKHFLDKYSSYVYKTFFMP